MDMLHTASRAEDMARRIRGMAAAVDEMAGQLPKCRTIAAETMRWMREASGLMVKSAANMERMNREASR